MANSMMPATIEIYADFICPWCYIGLDRLIRLANERPVRLHASGKGFPGAQPYEVFLSAVDAAR